MELLWDLLDTGAFCFFTFLVCDTTPDKEQLKGEKVHFSSQFKGVQSIMEVKAQGREVQGIPSKENLSRMDLKMS